MGDLGTFVPLAVGLILTCGLSSTAVLAGAGLFYLCVATVYRLPVPVQPMKAITAIALANELSPDTLAAAGLLMGVALTVLSATGLLDQIARVVPVWLVRAVQVAVGLALVKVALGLVGSAPDVFTRQLAPAVAVPIALAVVALCVWKPLMILPALVAGAVVVAASAPGFAGLGPSELRVPEIGPLELRDALFLLVLPQLPLTMTSSCIATADAAHAYYGKRAWRVRPSALAQSIGAANLIGGLTGAMAMCHGSGGVSAHHVFGARTWRAPVIIGVAMLGLGVVFGQNVVGWVSAFPLPLLAGLIGVVAVTHVRLVAGLPRHQQAGALALGVCGFHFGVASMVVAVTAVLALLHVARRLRSRRAPAAHVAVSAASEAPLS